MVCINGHGIQVVQVTIRNADKDKNDLVFVTLLDHAAKEAPIKMKRGITLSSSQMTYSFSGSANFLNTLGEGEGSVRGLNRGCPDASSALPHFNKLNNIKQTRQNVNLLFCLPSAICLSSLCFHSADAVKNTKDCVQVETY